MEEHETEKTAGYKALLWILGSVSLVLIIFSFWAPKLLTKAASTHDIDFSKTGSVGDTIGGLMNPFIALSGVLVTFLAFYIQYKFNEFQIKQFRTELKKTESKYDRDKFENQFYEMLRLHKENVNELYVKIKKKNGDIIIEETIYGRRVFEFFALELSVSYIVALYSFKNENLEPKKILNEAYGAFFHGISENDFEVHPYFKNLKKLQTTIQEYDYDAFDAEIAEHVKLKEGNKISRKIEFQIFEGYNHQLAHYYRHLYQTVKFVATQNETFISYSQKRNYLRILRAQLSNNEQVLLFYNWHSDFGKQWENDDNKFLTDFRMIHNIYDELLIDQFKLEEIFDLNGDYRKEQGRISDNLFEFQDW